MNSTIFCVHIFFLFSCICACVGLFPSGVSIAVIDREQHFLHFMFCSFSQQQQHELMLAGFAYIARPKMCYIMSMRFRFTCVNYNRFGKCTEKAEEFIFVKWFDFILMDFISFYMLQRIFFVILSLDVCSIYFYFIDYLLFFLSVMSAVCPMDVFKLCETQKQYFSIFNHFV